MYMTDKERREHEAIAKAKAQQDFQVLREYQKATKDIQGAYANG
jgi:hypothetical protein